MIDSVLKNSSAYTDTVNDNHSEVIEDNDLETIKDMGSHDHSYLQAKLAAIFFNLGHYTALTELSLDIDCVDLKLFDIKLQREIKPDICIYPKHKPYGIYDVMRMTEMPLLVIEIVSPFQGIKSITDKFAVYFALGIQSCWLVYPTIATIAVYHGLEDFKVFSSGELIDDPLAIRLSLADVFS